MKKIASLMILGLLLAPVVRPAGAGQESFFLSATVSAPTVYVHEQAIYTLKLHRRTRVRDVSLKLPRADHILFKQLGRPLEYQRDVGGINFQVLEIRYALVVGKAGNFMIAPAIVNLTEDPVFSFSTGQTIELASKPVSLKVLALPSEGKPDDFTGLVGRFSIESQLAPATVTAGKSATLTVTISGRGDLTRIPDLKVPRLANIHLYADEPGVAITADANGLTVTKTMRWALVAEKAGTYPVPPLTVSFFDPRSRQYRQIKTAAHTLSVLPGEAKSPPTAGASGPVKEPVRAIARDILPVHTSVQDVMVRYPSRPGGGLSLLFLFIPVLAYVLTLFIMRFQKKSLATVAATKARKAAGVFIQQCRKEGVGAGDYIVAVRDYLNARFGLLLGSLTPDEAADILTSKGARPETTEKLRTSLEKLENAIYTGYEGDTFGAGEKLPDIIKQVEKEIQRDTPSR